jgi:hypothetical protein
MIARAWLDVPSAGFAGAVDPRGRLGGGRPGPLRLNYEHRGEVFKKLVGVLE